MTATRIIKTNGVDLFITELGEGPLVILCHGWPELSYSWRHQMKPLADAGFHVVAPDMRGFGMSSAPEDISAYSIFDTVGDVVGLVAALGESKAIVVGHDWGAPVAWHAAMFRPDIFTAVAGLSVPPPMRAKGPPLEKLRKDGIHNFYWQYFQEPGIAEAEFEHDIDHAIRAMFAEGFHDGDAGLFVKPGQGFLSNRPAKPVLPSWISEAELAHFVANFQRSGFRGGFNWYRNIDRNWELTAPWHGATIHQPSLFLAGSRDSVITGLIGAKRVAELDRVLTDLRAKVIIDGAGHWVQQERPDEVNAALTGFLREVRSTQ